MQPEQLRQTLRSCMNIMLVHDVDHVVVNFSRRRIDLSQYIKMLSRHVASRNG